MNTNEYHQFFLDNSHTKGIWEYTSSKYHDECMARHEAVARWGFAIPTAEIIEPIVRLGSVVELGAGTGYWASLIKKAGGKIQAFDRYPTGEKSVNHYTFKRCSWFPVQRGTEHVLDKVQANVLLLVWPCYNSSFAYRALKRFRGQYVVYVGEGPGGCTANDIFHAELGKWTEVNALSIPQWAGIHDYMYIYKRQ